MTGEGVTATVPGGTVPGSRRQVEDTVNSFKPGSSPAWDAPDSGNENTQSEKAFL